MGAAGNGMRSSASETAGAAGALPRLKVANFPKSKPPWVAQGRRIETTGRAPDTYQKSWQTSLQRFLLVYLIQAEAGDLLKITSLQRHQRQALADGRGRDDGVGHARSSASQRRTLGKPWPGAPGFGVGCAL